MLDIVGHRSAQAVGMPVREQWETDESPAGGHPSSWPSVESMDESTVFPAPRLRERADIIDQRSSNTVSSSVAIGRSRVKKSQSVCQSSTSSTSSSSSLINRPNTSDEKESLQIELLKTQIEYLKAKTELLKMDIMERRNCLAPVDNDSPWMQQL